MSIGKIGVNLAGNVMNSALPVFAKSANTAAMPLTKSETIKALDLMRSSSLQQNKNIMQMFINKAPAPITDDVIAIRKNFIATVQRAGVSPKSTAELQKANTVGELQAAIYNFADRFQKCEINPILRLLKPKHIKTGSIPLEIEQMFYAKKNLRDDCVRWLHALFAKKSSNPQVKEIEHILKEQYGVKLALLGDDLLQARAILSSVEKAKQQGMRIPEEFIISNYKNSGGEYLRICDGGEGSVLIGSKALQLYIQKYCPNINLSPESAELLSRWKSTMGYDAWFSTKATEHVSFHEICHGEHFSMLSFKFKRIPKKYSKTINSISGYAASKPNATHETYTELNVKKRLAESGLCPNLTDNEKSLFKYLGGDV